MSRKNIRAYWALALAIALPLATWLAASLTTRSLALGASWRTWALAALVVTVDGVVAKILYEAGMRRRKLSAQANDVSKDLAEARGNAALEQRLNDVVTQWQQQDRSFIQWGWAFALLLMLELAALVAFQLPGGPWTFVVAVLPLLIVTYHASNLSADAPRSAAILDAELARALDESFGTKTARIGLLRNVSGRIAATYSVVTMLLRYWAPAIILAGVGFAAFSFVGGAHTAEVCSVSIVNRHAFAYGLAGAYAFIFLGLGRRSVRNDITPTAIMWCLITLCVGPIVAGLLPELFDWNDSSSKRGWKVKALYVFAGYSPRVVVESLMRFGETVFRPATKGLEQESRIALSRIQGIGADEAERLAEEGITEVHGLASVDPLRLMRDTRFDNWRILSWVDQALLVSCFRKSFAKSFRSRAFGALPTYFRQRMTDRRESRIRSKQSSVVSGETLASPNCGCWSNS